MAELQTPIRPRLTEAGVQMQLMFLNEPFTGEYRPGMLPSGFFSSLGRQFVMQTGSVLDHWKGFADKSPEVTPNQFAEMRGDRNLPMPDKTVTFNMAQRLIDRHDREEREQLYESNWRSVAGGLVGGLPPWLGSPEGLVGFLVPPVRVQSAAGAFGSLAATSVARSSTTRMGSVGREALAHIPAAAAMGGTNIMAQRAAYGEVDAVEAALVIGAPIALGAGIGAFKRGMTARAQAQRAASEMGDVAGLPQFGQMQWRIVSPVESTVPTRLVNDFGRWAGIEATDNTAIAFEKILTRMQAQGIPRDAIDTLVEAFARTGTRQMESTTNPEVRQAIRNLLDADNLPVNRMPPETRARIADLDNRIVETTQRLEKAQRELAKQSKAIKVFSLSGRARERMPANQAAAQRKALAETKKQQDNLKRLQEERAGLASDGDTGVPIVEKDVIVRRAINNLADVLARQTDHPLPAEFVADFMETVGLTAKLKPEAVKSQRLQVENPNSPLVTASTTRDASVLDEIANDPAFKAFVQSAESKAALRNYERADDILKGCLV